MEFNKRKILFQRLGKIWYAFSESGGNVVYSALPENIDPRDSSIDIYEVVNEHITQHCDHNKKAPETAA